MYILYLPDDCIGLILHYLCDEVSVRTCCSTFKRSWGSINKFRLSRALQASCKEINSCATYNCNDRCLGHIRWCERSTTNRYMPYCIIHFYMYSLMSSYTMVVRDATLTLLIPY